MKKGSSLGILFSKVCLVKKMRFSKIFNFNIIFLLSIFIMFYIDNITAHISVYSLKTYYFLFNNINLFLDPISVGESQESVAFLTFNLFSYCLPFRTFTNLHDPDSIKSYYIHLKKKKGVYSFYNRITKKQYIGSSEDLYKRMLEHLNNKKSNIVLQKAIKKYELKNFDFIIYEFYDSKNKNLTLIGLEDIYIKKFDFNTLYNLKSSATSLLGYKHTKESVLKMKLRFADKSQHPMYGKNHSDYTKSLISLKTTGILNPMFLKKHKDCSKKLMSIKKSKNIVELYDINFNLLMLFNNNVELAKYLSISKSTVGRYIKSGKLFNNKYYIKMKLKKEILTEKDNPIGNPRQPEIKAGKSQHKEQG